MAGREQAVADGARYFKKRLGLLCQRGEGRYAVIMQHQESWPVAGLCEVLDVRRSGFDADAPRQAAPGRDQDEVALLARVRAMHPETRQSYGSRRMAKQRQADGLPVGRSTARRLMQEANMAVRPRQRCPVTPDSRHGYAVAPNRLARQFAVEPSDTVWAGALTYLWTTAGWVY